MSADFLLVVNLPTGSKLEVFMSCYKPSFVQREVDLRSGVVSSHWLGSSKALDIFPWIRDTLEKNYDGQRTNDSLPKYFSPCKGVEIIQVPCGKCIGCRMDYSRSWADRMTYHSIGKEGKSYFLTFSYNDDSISSLDHNAIYDIYSLNYDHMTEFIKRFRNKFRDCEIDYYYSGEYGDSSFRPHFHAIVYNVEIPDLYFWKLNDNGDPLYTSEIIEGLWKKGFVVIGEFNWRNAAYTASYVEKKRDGRLFAEYQALGLEPEKCRCSRRPGIAFDFYKENFDSLWKNNGMSVPRDVNANGHLGLPRYFRKLAEDKRIGQSEFLEYKKRALDRINILTPLNLDNSSFDLKNIRQMLEFEEREILSDKKLREGY